MDRGVAIGLGACIAAVAAALALTAFGAQSPTQPHEASLHESFPEESVLVEPEALVAEPVVHLPEPPEPPAPVQEPEAEPPPEPQAPENGTQAPAPRPADPYAAEKADARTLHCTNLNWHCRTYSWDFAGGSFWLVLQLDSGLYNTYRTEEKPVRLVQSGTTYAAEPAYDIYVSDPRDDAFIGRLARELRRMAQAAGLNATQELSFALSFVQGLPYTSDSVTTGFDEYPRYPLETLVDNGGDCEDSAILFASIAQALGHEAILLSPPRHMAVGVAAADGAIEVAGRRYHYAETTGDGWAIGEVPREYVGAVMQTWRLDPTPLFALRGASVTGRDASLHVQVQVKNVGSVAAPAQVVAEVRGTDAMVHSIANCAVDFLWPGAAEACTIELSLRGVPQGKAVRLELRVQTGSQVHDALRTAEFTPWP